MIFWLVLTLPGPLMWLIVAALPWRPWHPRPCLEASPQDTDESLADVTILIPARNEAALIDTTLRAARAQSADLQIIVIDDNSTDNTAAVVHDSTNEQVRLLLAPPAPPGWSGKLWALEQGLMQVERPLTLLLDADIELSPGILASLRRHHREQDLTLSSLFVTLRMQSAWERLLVPAFGYFFRLLYPFRLSNAPGRRTAAAAGGTILVETEMLRRLGGFAAYKDALIDDCELARRIKANGGKTWIGLTRSAHSRRPYPSLASLWDLVARCAYVQLHYSLARLLLCTALILLSFLAPVAGLFTPAPAARVCGGLGLLAMMACYLPTLHYYQRNKIWALTLPLVGLLYLAMTWSSAIRYWRGTRSRWKGRDYCT